MDDVRKLERKYELLTLLRAHEQTEKAIAQDILRLTYEEREARVAYIAYQNSGAKRFFERLLGKPDKEEFFRQEASRAKAALEQQKQTLERQRVEGQALRDALAELPDLVFPEPDSPQWERASRAKVRYCASWLMELLPKTKEALICARDFSRLDTITEHRRVEMGKLDYLQEASGMAKQIYDLLLQLKESDVDVTLHPYFPNPVGYIQGLASEFSQLDRLNKALDGIAATEKEISELLKRVEE